MHIGDAKIISVTQCNSLQFPASSAQHTRFYTTAVLTGDIYTVLKIARRDRRSTCHRTMVKSITAENARAAARQKLGFAREHEQARRVASHPSKGGSHGYDVTWRQAELHSWVLKLKKSPLRFANQELKREPFKTTKKK